MVILATLLSLILCQFQGSGNLYAETAIVTEINYATDEVVVECFNGNLFAFKGTDDWAEGDICSMLMNDNGTLTVTDDEIVSVKYSGYMY